MNMKEVGFPINIPERLPLRITPCPIVEAIFEIRFSSPEPWEVVPGLLYSQIKEKYPIQKKLPLADFPEEIRSREPAMRDLPLFQYHGTSYLVQLGPRCISLVTRPLDYSGWESILRELSWFMEKLKLADFVEETERIGVRYIDFFESNLFENFNLQIHIGENALISQPTEITTSFRLGLMSLRIKAANHAIYQTETGVRTGSILDMDAWFGALDADCFTDGLDRIEEAHTAIKGLFFGLMKPEFLDSLKPEYK